MIRMFLFVVAAGLGLSLAGLAYLGLFPPHPPIRQVVSVVPNSRFAAGR